MEKKKQISKQCAKCCIYGYCSLSKRNEKNDCKGFVGTAGAATQLINVNMNINL
jgi:hypothetical protein